MKFVVIAILFFNSFNFAQSCVFDGKEMKSIGVSEVVNKETLSLYRCSDGHQMWLTHEELMPIKQEVIEVVKYEKSFDTERTIENHKLDSEEAAILALETLPNDDSHKVVKTEKVMKRESLGSNLSNSLSIEKFGLETLLFKKLESDRKFAKQLENEKSELLHMMYTQKKLFERVNNKKFSFKEFKLFSKIKIYYIYLPIALVFYVAI